jgi:hypothetical protein
MICRLRRTATCILTVCALWITFAITVKAQSTPSAQLDALISNARKNGDAKAEKRVTNLKLALSQLKPSDLDGVRCGKDSAKTAFNVEQAQDVAGKLLDKALEKYLPTLAAALASTPAAGVAAFLTPEKIGPDSVEVLNQNEKRSRQEVQDAARQLLQDTTVESFQKLPKSMMAKIVVCAL